MSRTQKGGLALNGIWWGSGVGWGVGGGDLGCQGLSRVPPSLSTGVAVS